MFYIKMTRGHSIVEEPFNPVLNPTIVAVRVWNV